MVRKRVKEAPSRLQQLKAIGREFDAFVPASEVLTEVRAVPTRFVQLDHATKVGGWPIERFTMIHGPSNHGKATSVDARILTPRGWARMGDLKVGDEVTAAADGEPTAVTGVYPQGELQLYKVTFSDGESVECCAEHLWHTTTPKERARGSYARGPRPERRRIKTGVRGRGSVKSTAEILERFVPGEHAIPLTAPVWFESLGAPILDPYLLGLLLGDGGFTSKQPVFHKPERDLQEQVRRRLPGDGDSVVFHEDGSGVRVNGGELKRRLAKLDLWGLRSWEKFIPEIYLRAPVGDRLQLLRGLCDTDGHVLAGGGAVEYSTSSPSLARDVVELVRSLGGLVITSVKEEPRFTYKGEVRTGKPSARINIHFPAGVVPVASKKHLSKWKGPGKRALYRTIESIEPSRVAEARCIRVAHPERLYVLEGHVVTHNTESMLGLFASFLALDHMAHFIDAERTTPMKWVRTLMGPLADHPGFTAQRPDTYEGVMADVRNFCNLVIQKKKSGDLDPDTSVLFGVDSLRKLVPRDLMREILEAAKMVKAGDLKGGKDRSAQVKARMNAAWMDEVVPLLEKAGAGMVVIGREMEDPDADPNDKKWGNGYKVGGGGAVFYDSSLVVRVERAGWVQLKREGQKGVIYGERHRLTIRKTKVGGKDDKVQVAHYHTSNGAITPEGFDRGRDVLELAERFGIVTKSGAQYSYDGDKLGAGQHNVAVKLADDPELLRRLEADVRASFVEHTPQEFDPETGEIA